MMITMLLTLAACSKDTEECIADGIGPMYNMTDEAAEELGAGTGDGDRVGKLVENPFISTAEENVSTFSADVDTASYAYFRRLLQSGYSLSELIATAGDSIRTEEMLNYFDYGYDAPAEGELFSARMQIAPCPWNEDARLLTLGLQAKKVETAAKNNLVFLIDVSGSMNSDDKLGLLKTAFSYLTAQLGADDTVSIVTYSGKEQVVLEGCDGNHREAILYAVDSLTAGGSTNGEAGLQRAYELAEKYFIADGNNRIVMASDGDLNVGISSADELEDFVSEKRESGVFLSVLGFGTGNYRDDRMERIADCGNGVYYYIDSESEAERVFGDKLFSTLYTVAKDVKLQMTFAPEAVSAYRLVGYENRILNREDFEDDTKDAGELGAGHSLTVCYELILTDAAMETERWMTLDVRYKAPDGDKSEEDSYDFGRSCYTDTPDERFRFICTVVETSMLLHESEYGKGVTIEGIKAELDALTLDDEYMAQFRDLIGKLV